MSDDFDVTAYPDEFVVVRVGDDFQVQMWPDEFIIVDQVDDWTIYTTTETTYVLEFQAVGLNDTAIAIAARDAALAAQAATEAIAAQSAALLGTMAGGTTGQIIIKASNADYDFGWANPTGMLTAIYDPTNIMADAFARANHTGTQLAATISNFNAAADARIAAAVGVSVQAYSAILAGTTASYTVAKDTKLNGIATGADVTVDAIHAAASKATPVDADELGLADSASGFSLKKLTWANVKAGILAYWNGTAKAVPVDADRVWQGDSTTANTPVYSTWTQVKAFLKTYFDTFYGRLATAGTWTAVQTFTGTGGVGNSAIVVSGNAPTIAMQDTDASAYDYWMHVNSNHWYVLADRNNDGNFEAPHPLDMDAAGNVGFCFGSQIWTAGNDGAGSGLDADLVDGFQSAQANTASTVAVRDGSGDITTRLFRTEFSGGGWNGAYMLGINANGGAGADNYARPTPIATVMAKIFQAGYTSPAQTMTAGGALTLAHGLGVQPQAVALFLINTVAEGNYAVNDIISVSQSAIGMFNVDATNINVRFSSAAPGLFNKTTGAAFSMNFANWKAIYKAWG